MTPDREAVRDTVRRWADEHWNPDMTVRQWWRALADAGYLQATFPVGYGGRGWPMRLARAVGSALADVGTLGVPQGAGLGMAAPALLEFANPEQLDRHLTPLVRGELAWTQLFSEPGAGSDLAGITTRAVQDGDSWIIDGAKVWSSLATVADWGILLARTNFDAPKHAGITYFLIDLDQPGVEVRPLREMSGGALFAQVFFDGARVDARDVLGSVNDGWRVALATLAAERAGIGGDWMTGGSTATPGQRAGDLDRRAGDFLGHKAVTFNGGRVTPGIQRRLLEAARTSDRIDRPGVRSAILDLHVLAEVSRFNGIRARDPRSRSGAEANISKLLMAELARRGADVASRIGGPDAVCLDDGVVGGGRLADVIQTSPAPAIYGGSDQIQKNIIGERVLGLPREPGPGPETPFRELPTNAG